jgi:hypothetical protein
VHFKVKRTDWDLPKGSGILPQIFPSYKSAPAKRKKDFQTSLPGEAVPPFKRDFRIKQWRTSKLVLKFQDQIHWWITKTGPWQWHHSQAYLIWPDGPFKEFTQRISYTIKICAVLSRERLV